MRDLKRVDRRLDQDAVLVDIVQAVEKQETVLFRSLTYVSSLKGLNRLDRHTSGDRKFTQSGPRMFG